MTGPRDHHLVRGHPPCRPGADHALTLTPAFIDDIFGGVGEWVTVCVDAVEPRRPEGSGQTRMRGRLATPVIVAALGSLAATAGGIAVSLATSDQWPGWLEP